ncbi:MAG: ATP-dependent DNA helicase [Acidimicrobiia bacterium]
MSTLFDDAARTAIASDLDRNLFVEAGAGTGKTSALVARVVALVRTGTPISQIAAITFTEAAAAELRERIREALGEAALGEGAHDVHDNHDVHDDQDVHVNHDVHDDHDGRDSIPSTSQAQHCRAALARFDEAAISTLHAFAHRVLAEFPVEAGLPPGFEVLDDIQADIEFAERWSSFLDQVYDDPTLHRALTVVGALGLRIARLETLARLIHADWDRLGDDPLPPIRPVPPVEVSALIGALDDAVAFAADCREPTDNLLAHLGTVAAFRDALRDASRARDEAALLEVIADRPRIPSGAGQKRHWADKPAVVAALARADEVLRTLLDAIVGSAIGQLLHAVVGFVRASVEQRRRAGRLEFHDLLVLARDLVRRDATVRAALHDRYHHLLLDEFQDTDPLQIELAVLIATSDADVDDRPWWECSVAPGRLFVVGDPKQSIYRFRRADIELYHQVRDFFGERLSLSTSFRSRPAVIEFVNSVFRALLGDGDPSGLQAAYDALLPVRADDDAPITIVGAEHPRDTDLASLRRQEAQELAELVRRVRDEGWLVARRGPDGEERLEPARFADIAVLLPTRTTLAYLEHALDDARVPARIESQSLVFATSEVQELLAILTAIDDPADEIAIVAALRAPAFACRDDRLLEFREAGGRWDYRAPTPVALPPSHPVVSAMTALADLHEQRWWDTVSETVERVVRERRLMELAVARPRPRDHWRRIRFVADAARAFVDGGGTSLRGFVSWLTQQVEEEARAVEVVVPEPDDDAVRILTVHGAKGLEFPIVVLAGLGVGDRHAAPAVLWDADGALQVQIGPRDAKTTAFRYLSPGYEARADLERAAAAAEALRVLYVAATRARDHLVVSVHHRRGDESPAARLLPPINAASQRCQPAPALDPATRQWPEPAPAAPPAGADDGVAWAGERARRIARARRRPVAAATALAAAAQAATDSRARGAEPALGVPADPNLRKDEAEADRPAFRRGRGGTSVGRAVHAVLQTVDLATGRGLQAAARAQALAEGVPEREAEIRELAAAALRAPVVRRAVEAAWPAWREVPVAATVDGVLVEGFVDLLVETPDGLVIVDYKTDRVPAAADLHDALERYAVQGGAYALALEAALERTVQRCVFVFARDAAPLECDVTDLARAKARARAALSSVG